MSAHYDSKHGVVRKTPAELYMAFTDLRNFASMVPEQYKGSVTADFDNLKATIQGFTVGVCVDRRDPYRLIKLISTDSPVEFAVNLHFDARELITETDFWIEVDANLNLVMKAMLGGKLREALDKIVDGLVAVSEGRMPEGMPADFDPSKFGG